jgi:glycosyltransferase involved in cell wall biosynthesis
MLNRLKLGVLATHPIQYHAPLFRELAQREDVDLTVYFCHRPTASEQGQGFGVAFEWDVDLLAGYRHSFLQNVSREPTQGFLGYDTPEVSDIIFREKFDVFIVHGWSNKANWQAFRACWRTGTRVAVRSDSQLPQGRVGVRQSIKSMIKRLVYPLFIKRFDYCLPYGQRSAEYFQHYFGKNITISPHFVDNDFFIKESERHEGQRNKIRQRWSIPSDAYCFLFCGKFQPMKRPMDILLAMQYLFVNDPGKRQPIHLLMVGDGELRMMCQKFANSHNLPVSFTSFLNQKEIVESYIAADCLVLASDTETWGLVVNEAMVCGLPAIVSDACGCVPDLIVEGETGYSFPCGNINLLSKKMHDLSINNETILHRMGQSNCHIHEYSVKKAANCLISAIAILHIEICN